MKLRYLASWPNPGEKAQTLLEKLLKFVGLAKKNAWEEVIWLIVNLLKSLRNDEDPGSGVRGSKGSCASVLSKELEVVGLEPPHLQKRQQEGSAPTMVQTALALC